MGSRSESVRRYWKRRHALWNVSPGEFVELQKHGTISESLKQSAVGTQEETLSIVAGLGGVENISEQRLVLVQDTARLGLVLRAVMARFLQGDGDPELASRVATITSARRQNLQALGLERVSKELDLQSYLAERAAAGAQDRAEEEIAARSGTTPTDASEDASVDNESGVLEVPPPASPPSPSTGPDTEPHRGDPCVGPR